MYSTGPLFLSVMWKEYMLSNLDEVGRVRILMPDEYNKHSWSFFTHHKGNSWHGKDARLIFWVRFYKYLLLWLNRANVNLTDGRPLDASYHHWIPSRWHCWLLPLVGLRTTSSHGILVPLSLFSSSRPLSVNNNFTVTLKPEKVGHAIVLSTSEHEERRRRERRCDRYVL